MQSKRFSLKPLETQSFSHVVDNAIQQPDELIYVACTIRSALKLLKSWISGPNKMRFPSDKVLTVNSEPKQL